MDALTTFGALSVASMLLFYALEERSPWFVLAFAAACLASSAYGFLQGAWPLSWGSLPACFSHRGRGTSRRATETVRTLSAARVRYKYGPALRGV